MPDLALSDPPCTGKKLDSILTSVLQKKHELFIVALLH